MNSVSRTWSISELVRQGKTMQSQWCVDEHLEIGLIAGKWSVRADIC